MHVEHACQKCLFETRIQRACEAMANRAKTYVKTDSNIVRPAFLVAQGTLF